MAHFVKLSGVDDISRNGRGEKYSILVNVDNIVSIGRSNNGNYTLLNTVNNTVLRVTEDLDVVAKLCGCIENKVLNG